MMLDPPKGSMDAGLKDMFTSKDWMNQYHASHIDIDYQNQSFSSGSSQEPESATAPPAALAPPAPEIPRSADLNYLLLNPPKPTTAKTATTSIDAQQAGELKEALKAAGVGIGFGTLPPLQFPGYTDWMSEYNSMFAGAPVTTEELANQAKIPSVVPEGVGSMPPSFDLNVFLKSSMDMTGDSKKSLPPSIDILKHLVKKSVDVPPPAVGQEHVPAPAPIPALQLPLPEKKKLRKKGSRSRDPAVKEYVEPTDLDVLLGRGGRSNHHPGNKRYRDEVHNLQKWYKASAKPEKTDLSQCLVNYIHTYGGRFLKLDKANGKWFIVTNIVARRKASQALREHMTMEERAARKAELAKKAVKEG